MLLPPPEGPDLRITHWVFSVHLLVHSISTGAKFKSSKQIGLEMWPFMSNLVTDRVGH